MNQIPEPRRDNTVKIVLIILGCLFLVCLGGGGTAIYSFFKWGKSLDVYQTAFARAASNPQVIEYMGDPLEDGFFPTFSVNFEGGFGEASYSNSLSGPHGSGTLEIMASMTPATGWTFTYMRVVFENGAIVDLRQPGDMPPAPGATQDRPAPPPPPAASDTE